MKKLILVFALFVAAPVMVQANQQPQFEIMFEDAPNPGRSFLGIGDGKPGVFGIGTGNNMSAGNYNKWNQNRREFKGFKKIKLPKNFSGKKP